ncbi:MAG TPA: Ig-like domain-containing protein [Gemmatimonadales bacterium]|nr:Ig-like domain-containing protein [Gemmatimonadales bacterium]
MSLITRPSRLASLGSPLVLALALGCGGGGTTDPDPDPGPDPEATVASVTVTPDNSLVPVDGVGQLTAVVTDSDGTILTDRVVTWSSLDDSLATVSTTGEVSALSYGDARIVATSDGKSDTVTVRARLRFSQISAGGDFTCGLLASGAAWCWGLNQDGMLGAGLSGQAYQSPVRVVGAHHFTTLSVGRDFVCGLDEDLAAWCWGENVSGELGNGLAGTASAPTRVLGDHRFLAIAAGGDHTCAFDESHLAWCWGSAADGRIPGTTEDATVPVALPAPPDWPAPLTFATIKANLGLTCGIAADLDGGDLWCWGDNDFGQIMDASVAGPLYSRIDAPLTPFEFGVGSNFICYTGVNRDDRQTPISQCRGVDIARDRTPNTVGDYPAAVGAVAMDAGAGFACVVLDGGTLRCWGQNLSGQLGIGGVGGPLLEPVSPLGGHSWAAIDLGFFYTCGIATDQIAYCWGENGTGKLGDGTSEPRYVPTAVAGQL